MLGYDVDLANLLVTVLEYFQQQIVDLVHSLYNFKMIVLYYNGLEKYKISNMCDSGSLAYKQQFCFTLKAVVFGFFLKPIY